MTTKITNQTLDSLRYDDDPFFAGCGQRALGTADFRGLRIERRVSAEGDETYTAYRPAAMRRAIRRSEKAGGGVRGMCADFLRDHERVELPGCDTVGDAYDRLKWEEEDRKRELERLTARA